METPIQARDRWRTLGEAIRFTSDDFDVVDLALHVMPDLRICALALKQARAKKVRYPIQSVDDLLKYLDKGRLVAGEHVIDAEEIRAYLHEGFFPDRARGRAAYTHPCGARPAPAGAGPAVGDSARTHPEVPHPDRRLTSCSLLRPTVTAPPAPGPVSSAASCCRSA